MKLPAEIIISNYKRLIEKSKNGDPQYSLDDDQVSFLNGEIEKLESDLEDHYDNTRIDQSLRAQKA